MPPANPAEKLLNAPLEDLVGILLKQFKRLFNERGVTLTSAQIDAIAQAAAAKQPLPEPAPALVDILVTLVRESINLLQERFDFSFAESLRRSMDSIPRWETTAEFIEIANEKSNAELRISAGASLLACLGEARFAQHLIEVIVVDEGVNDVDAVFAKRALSHLSGLDWRAEHWLQQLRGWLNQHAHPTR